MPADQRATHGPDNTFNPYLETVLYYAKMDIPRVIMTI